MSSMMSTTNHVNVKPPGIDFSDLFHIAANAACVKVLYLAPLTNHSYYLARIPILDCELANFETLHGRK